ncbi:hypothetical protein DYB32_008656, partial [Aphanomyces invadans]
KLQQKFNSDIFKTVQTEYIAEGIPLELVSFEDNQPILDLIEGRMGLVDLLNETGVLAKATDAAFVGKIHEAFSTHKYFEKLRTNPMQFKIHHYAGDVIYNGENFLDKNKDTLPPDMLELLASSKSPFIRDVFPELTHDKPNKPGRRQGFLVGATIANSFRKQLGELMEQVAKTTTQYVRCIKPNANKSAREFDRQMVVDQLRCAGVIAAIRISRAAFPNRLTLHEFGKRFDVICPPKLRHAAPEAMVLGLLEKLGITDSSSQNAKFAIGKSKVYFSSGLLQYLEEQRTAVLRKQAILIQSHMRGRAKRKQFLAIIQATRTIQKFVRGWIARRRWHVLCRGIPQLQSVVRGFVQRRKFRVLLHEARECNRLRMLAEANAQLALSVQNHVKRESEEAPIPPRAPPTPTALGSPYFNGEIPDSPKKRYPMQPSSSAVVSAKVRDDMAKSVEEAHAMAEQARQAAKEAMQLNAALQVENEQLKAKLTKNAREYADEDLRQENERLRAQLAMLQSKIIRADEVALLSAKVVDSRLTYRDGKQFVEYKLQIETNNRGTLFVWHRYSTFRNLATTLQTKNGYARKDIPELPNKTLFNNFTDKTVQERVEKLNAFLDAATKADYLQWGIRIDAETCVYKRRVKGSTSGTSSYRYERPNLSHDLQGFGKSKRPQHLVELAVYLTYSHSMDITARNSEMMNVKVVEPPKGSQGSSPKRRTTAERDGVDEGEAVVESRNSKFSLDLKNKVEERPSTTSSAIDVGHLSGDKAKRKYSPRFSKQRSKSEVIESTSMTSVALNMFKQRLTMNDFMRVDKREFPPNPRSKLTHSFKFKVREADYMVTLCGDFNYIEFMSNSKSGQFFFYSHDGRFMIKTQTQDESKFLRRILPHYYKNSNTLVTRFYGMHRVKMHHTKKQQMHFVIMASVFNTPKEIHLRFDLKGSKVGRNASVDEKTKNGVLKDNDLVEEHIHLSLGPEKRAMMLEQLRKV